MTKKIKLTQGKFALVDDSDYKWLNQFKWQARKNRRNWYAHRNTPKINGKKTKVNMHREILGLEPFDGKEVDHINRNGLDNRRSNLRIANQTINQRNQRKHTNNTSGFTGVHWYKRLNKWRANIHVNHKTINLGVYSNLLDAVRARKQAEIKYWQ